jgi:subtilisin family serine protease
MPPTDFVQTYVIVEHVLGMRGRVPPPISDQRGGFASRPFGTTKSLGLDLSEIGVEVLSTEIEEAPDVRVHTGVHERDALDALRSPSTAGAPTMDTILIAPLAADDSDDDPDGSTWGLKAIRADTSSLTGQGVKVAVLDTGIDASHQAFKGMTIDQEDFSGDGLGDRNGHGTHCAAIFFGRPVDGVRVGVAQGISEALIGKILRDDRSGTTDMLFAGLDWALRKGARVISMSLGLDFPGYVRKLTNVGVPADLATSRALLAYGANLRLIDNFSDQVRLRVPMNGGALLIAACGNESRADQDPDYRIAASLPSEARGIISVGALQKSPAGLTVAPFSNTLPRVTAPGVAVKSARVGGGLTSKSGTSMAAPHVAGVAALWWEWLSHKDADVRSPQVEVKLLGNVADDVFAPEVRPVDRGDGLVVAPQH